MKCFRHNEVDAVGSCKACSKGLCRECAREVEGSLACLDVCEKRVRQLETFYRAAVKNYDTSRRNVWFLPVAFILLGLLFIALALVSPLRTGITIVIIASGIVIVVFGVFFGYVIHKFVKAAEVSDAAPTKPAQETNST